MIQITKPKYPVKQTINLAIQKKNRLKTSIQLGSFVLFLLVLAVFVKFAVIDRINAAVEAERLYKETQKQIELLQEKTKEYDEVLKAYRIYTNAFYNESEAAELDRLDIISFVENCVLDKADIRNINIADSMLTIALENTNLPSVSEIVAAIEEDERAVYVTVTTAANGNNQKQNKTVSANIVIRLKSGGEE
ncbi:hypothetical protein [Clostridium sp. Marseille-P299]|uniref:hypothetical protein n=1 Tax=Clostridium sp. Marseille-P299 TaxID=1805477 RepID=UPI00082AE4CF|nr:hypothetical protein [Clostridium sp. Marseille-P299]